MSEETNTNEQPEVPAAPVETPEEAKPVGEAVIVDTTETAEQFPPHDEANASK